MALMRLDKFLSGQTGMSRSEAREVLKSLRVCVNGRTEKFYDYKINPETDSVTVDGKTVSYSEHVYLLMNKPKGVLTATEDSRQPTVLDLVPENLRRKNLAPVGRLDKDTTGLLLLSDNGVFAHKVISPKSHIEKEYVAVLDGDITDEHIKLFADGVVLADGTKCMPAILKRIAKNTASIVICEGKYHQIKRMFGVVGLGVNELSRIRIGNLTLPNDLAEGEIAFLSEKCQFFERIGIKF